MGATKKLFNDMREVKEFEAYDHNANFCKKVKENWLTTQEFSALKSADYIELTIALNRKMDSEYREKIMQWIDEREPKYISEQKYIELVGQSTLENMQRIIKKYDNIDYFIKAELKKGLELLIFNKQNNENK